MWLGWTLDNGERKMNQGGAGMWQKEVKRKRHIGVITEGSKFRHGQAIPLYFMFGISPIELPSISTYPTLRDYRP